MLELKIMRGCAGSGKSYQAAQFAKNNPGWVIVSRDDIRYALFKEYFGPKVDEDLVTKAEHALISAALSSGLNVISDNTNLTARFANNIAHIGYAHGAVVTVEEVKAPLDVCKARNLSRERKVPENVLESQYQRSLKTYRLPDAPREYEPYVHDFTKEEVVLCDLDNTLSLNVSGRNPYSTDNYHLDVIDADLARILKAIDAAGIKVIFMTARDESGRPGTEQWLEDNGFGDNEVVMRPVGDKRKDWVTKFDMIDEFILPKYRIVAAFDDRRQVVEAYRRRGIPVYQVRDGDF